MMRLENRVKIDFSGFDQTGMQTDSQHEWSIITTFPVDQQELIMATKEFIMAFLDSKRKTE